MMAPEGKRGEPSADLKKAMESAFGGMDNFKKEFAAKAGGQFGSGWGWLVVDKDMKLSVVSTANQDNPVSDGHLPLLGIDVWEHAYYLKYQNKRADYIDAWFNVVNWNRVNDLFQAAH
jgi:Fe-Mn family superoxide dismutase